MDLPSAHEECGKVGLFNLQENKENHSAPAEFTQEWAVIRDAKWVRLHRWEAVGGGVGVEIKCTY
jgi:hypothetical protein